MVELFRIRVKQQEWWKQIFPEITKRRKGMDRLSIAEINELYDRNKILCTDCGKELDIPDFYKPIDHIMNLLSPSISCDDCLYHLYKTGNILAGEIPQEWVDRKNRENESH